MTGMTVVMKPDIDNLHFLWGIAITSKVTSLSTSVAVQKCVTCEKCAGEKSMDELQWII